MLQAGLAALGLLGLCVLYWTRSSKLTYVRTIDDVDAFFNAVVPPHSIHEILHNQCKWPVISPVEPEIRPFLKAKKFSFSSQEHAEIVRLVYATGFRKEQEIMVLREKCERSPFEGGVSLNNDGFVFVSEQLSNSSSVSCVGMELSLDGHAKAHFGARIELKPEVGSPMPFNSFVVECSDLSGQLLYSQPFVNLAPSQARVKKLVGSGDVVKATPTAPSLAILSIRSASYAEMRRQLPSTLEFAHQNGFISSAMLSKVHSDPERNFETTFPAQLWVSMKERGCISMKNGMFGAFDADLDLSAWVQVLRKKSTETSCDDSDQNVGGAGLETWASFSKLFVDTCHFSLVDVAEFDDFGPPGDADKRLRNALEVMKANGVFESTTLVILSSDGVRNGKFGDTYAGRIEERNPFLLVRVPEKFRNEFPQQVFNLVENSNRLITNLDVGETLKSLASLDLSSNPHQLETSLEDDLLGGHSLLKQRVSENRTCEAAGIPKNFCLCMRESKTSVDLLDSKSDAFNTLYEHMQTDVLAKEKCVVETTNNELRFPNVRVWQLDDAVLNDGPPQRDGAVPFDPPIEFYEFGIRAFAPRPRKGTTNLFFDMFGRFRHYIYEDRLEKAAPFVITWKNEFCLTSRTLKSPRVDGFCELCYDKLLLSP